MPNNFMRVSGGEDGDISIEQLHLEVYLAMLYEYFTLLSKA